MNTFVTAIWSDLLIVSYAVPDETLTPFIGPGLEIDRWERRAHISLVAFRFRQSRVIYTPKIATLWDFPQWNLRMYVKPQGSTSIGNERGIVFVKEYVPQSIVAKSVNALYNEPYHTAPLTCRVTQIDQIRRVRYDLTAGGGRHILAATGFGPAYEPQLGTAESFFTGQGWGNGHNQWGKPTRFGVTHPTWRVYDIQEPHISVNFGQLYGTHWEFLQDQTPDSVILCEGSPVKVTRPLPR